MIQSDHFIDLLKALRGPRVRTEVASEAIGCNLTQFVRRRLGVRDIFAAKPGQSLGQVHRL
jgi:hypothetical protein